MGVGRADRVLHVVAIRRPGDLRPTPRGPCLRRWIESAHAVPGKHDHVVLERGEIANSLRHERWDSLTLLTPNWQCKVPGYMYSGDDPDGFMPVPQLIEFIDEYAAVSSAPVQTNTEVTSVRPHDGKYRLSTEDGD